MKTSQFARATAVAVIFAVPFAEVAAQRTDTLRLGALHADAIRLDPRSAAFDILRAQSATRLAGIGAERLPLLSLNASSQRQSTVPRIPVSLPGVTIPEPPRAVHDAGVAARQTVFDPAVRGRRSVERATVADAEAQLTVSLHTLRQQVNQAFFGALRVQYERAALTAVVADLDAQLATTRARVAEGAALRSEADILEAELLRRRQGISALDSERQATLEVLGDLTGRQFVSVAELAIPDAGGEGTLARASLDAIRERPEFARYDRARDLLAARSSALSAQEVPRVSAFARAGYGRPGLNPLADEFDSYWLAGVQVEWTPWNRGATRRERSILELQQQILDREEEAFRATLRRSIARDLAAIDRLVAAAAEDDEILRLREQVLREARLRFNEGVLTSAEYVDRQTDALQARIARSIHRVELAEARSRLLTSLGLEVD